jgi:hypothetical protein
MQQGEILHERIIFKMLVCRRAVHVLRTRAPAVVIHVAFLSCLSSIFADTKHLHAGVAMTSYMKRVKSFVAEGSGVKDSDVTKFFAPGSRRNWMDDVVDPGDAIQDLEVDSDIFYDYFLSIPQVKTIRRFKDRKQDWYDKLAIIAAAMPDGLKWVEIEKPSPDMGTEIQHESLSKILEHPRFWNAKTREVDLPPRIWDSFQSANLIDLSGDSTYIKAPSGRYFKPAAMDGEKQAKDLKDDVKDRGGQDAVKMIVTCAAHFKRYTAAERTVTVLETQKKYKLYCATFDKDMPQYIPKRKKDNEVETKEFTNPQIWPGKTFFFSFHLSIQFLFCSFHLHNVEKRT